MWSKSFVHYENKFRMRSRVSHKVKRCTFEESRRSRKRSVASVVCVVCRGQQQAAARAAWRRASPVRSSSTATDRHRNRLLLQQTPNTNTRRASRPEANTLPPATCTYIHIQIHVQSETLNCNPPFNSRSLSGHNCFKPELLPKLLIYS